MTCPDSADAALSHMRASECPEHHSNAALGTRTLSPLFFTSADAALSHRTAGNPDLDHPPGTTGNEVVENVFGYKKYRHGSFQMHQDHRPWAMLLYCFRGLSESRENDLDHPPVQMHFCMLSQTAIIGILPCERSGATICVGIGSPEPRDVEE